MSMSVLATYPSKSNPNKHHEVRQGSDGVIYCTCPGWRFHNARTCTHIQQYENSRPSSASTPHKAIKRGSMQNGKPQDAVKISDVTANVIRMLKGER